MSDAAAAALDRLTHLHPKLIDLSLDRLRRLLAALGNPQDALPPVLHVAGTNGKGSVVATLRACLEASGRRVHVFTSPHLVRFNERIRVAGSIIADDPLVALLEEIERVNDGQPITFFEATTAAAYLAFLRTPADVVVLETGLGGRLDATNVIAKPAATVITPISMDHEQFLGNTVAAIAYEKACIQKPGVPSILSAQVPAARDVLLARAAEVGAPSFLEDRDWRVIRDGAEMVYEGRQTHRLPLPRLLGEHQIHNAGAAIAALEQAFPQGTAVLAQGLTSVEWPARMQRLTTGPLQALVPAGAELWLDGGHNPSAGHAIAALLAGWDGAPIDVICGMMANKDAGGYLGPLTPYIRRFRAVPVPGDPHQGVGGGRDPGELAAAAQAAGIADAAVEPDVATALAHLRPAAGERVLIAGSLYLAGSVLADNS